MNNRTYVIVDSAQASTFDFSQLIDIDEEHSAKSLDGSEILARFEGDTPTFLIGEPQHNQEEMLNILASDAWFIDQNF
tara:strand:+ start:1154 stop:1387 length:234 start_codon:yes stop_codon:yes gene_type:complete